MNNSYKSYKVFFIICILVLVCHSSLFSWGFYAHRTINRMAVFTLPPQMIGLFKEHIEYLTEQSVAPDKRAHTVKGEAPRHYIDVEHYAENIDDIPIFWQQAVEKYTEDTLYTHGLLPYHIYTMYFRLRKAFQDEALDRILYNAAHIGHYIADACTPLHNTKFYNGRTPEERGIHAFWETRLPLLTAKDFDFFIGRAQYIEKPQHYAWQLVKESHAAVDTIYMILDEMKNTFPKDKVFTYEMTGQSLTRQYSEEYALLFNKKLNGMVERQMQKSVLSVGSFWYTAWVDAGQPDLRKLMGRKIPEEILNESEELEKNWRQQKPIGRPNPEESIQ